MINYPFKAWSYSSLNAFETCPRRYQLTRVTKEVVERQHEASIYGNRVHKHLENYANKKRGLPAELQKYAKYVDKIFSYEGKHIVEQRMAIDKNFKPTKWMAPNVWCRGIIDIGVVNSDTAYLLDWKTGKRKPDSDQLKLFAALAFAHYPYISKIVCGFIWLKEGKFDKEIYTKEDIQDIWEEFLPRVQRVEIAYAEDKDKWQAKPSGLCKNWCPVGKRLCDFCGV